MTETFVYTPAFHTQTLEKLIRIKPYETNDRDITSILTQKLMGQMGDKCSKGDILRKVQFKYYNEPLVNKFVFGWFN